MKKALSFILFLALTVSLLTSCSTVRYKDVKSLKIEEVTCQTFYLYSFENAQVSDCQISDYSTYPTETGYIYSEEALSVGDEIEVWGRHSFGYYDENGYAAKNGTTATVSGIEESYAIELIRSGNAYTITFYNLPDGGIGSLYTVTNRDEAAEAQKYKVEVVTDNPVFIEFIA